MTSFEIRANPFHPQKIRVQKKRQTKIITFHKYTNKFRTLNFANKSPKIAPNANSDN